MTADLPDGLDISVRLSAPDGGWLDVSVDPYRIGGNAFGDFSQKFRRQSVTSPFVEGEFIVSSLRSNVEENLEVWVSGASAYDLFMNEGAILACVMQPRFTVERIVDGWKTVMKCWPSDYQVTASREYRHNRISLMKVTLNYGPNDVTHSEVI